MDLVINSIEKWLYFLTNSQKIGKEIVYILKNCEFVKGLTENCQEIVNIMLKTL